MYCIIICQITHLRVDESFTELFEKADSFRKAHDLCLPQKPQSKRLPKWLDEHTDTQHNPRSIRQTTAEYFCVLDRMIQSLNRRFDDQTLADCNKLEMAIIKSCSGQQRDEFQLPEVYSDVLNSSDMCTEVRMLPTLLKQSRQTCMTSFRDFISLLQKSRLTSLAFFWRLLR